MDAFYSKDGVRIPRPVLIFFLKAFALFVVWKAFYIFFLFPTRALDRPLTGFIGASTASMLNVGSGPVHYRAVEAGDTSQVDDKRVVSTAMDIRRDGRQTLRIADACNGLELMVLYAGFIFCFPAPAGKKLRYIPLGILLIMGMNILRCTALVWIFIHYNKYLDFSHHFLFTFLIYGLIFLLWFLFTKNLRSHDRPI